MPLKTYLSFKSLEKKIKKILQKKIIKKYWSEENSPANMGILNGRGKCTTNCLSLYIILVRDPTGR
jgi:hypothetical protein